MSDFLNKTIDRGQLWLKEHLTSAGRNWDHEYNDFPENVVLFLSTACDHRCRVCAQTMDEGRRKTLPREHMDFSLIEKLVREAKPHGLNVSLIGGEPLLYPQWRETVELAMSELGHCDIVTNGTQLEKGAEFIVEQKVPTLRLSLDGIESVHDAARGVPGSYRKAVAGLDALTSAKAKLGLQNPKVSLWFTISGANHDRLEEFIELVRDWSIDEVAFINLSFITADNLEVFKSEYARRMTNNKIDYSFFEYTPKDADGVVGAMVREQFERITTRELPFKISMSPRLEGEQFAAYYSDNDYTMGEKYGCWYLRKGTFMFPSGDIVPCLGVTVGNLRDQTLAEIWNDGPYQELRRELALGGGFTACQRCCQR